MKFLFSCLKHFTCSLCSLDIFQHSKRNFISLRSHVISSMYFALCAVSSLWQKERKCEARVSDMCYTSYPSLGYNLKVARNSASYPQTTSVIEVICYQYMELILCRNDFKNNLHYSLNFKSFVLQSEQQAMPLSVSNPSLCCLSPFHLVLCLCFKAMNVSCRNFTLTRPQYRPDPTCFKR